MAGFKEAFNNSHAVLPVVHVEDSLQALRNTQIAKKEGADGVFLIDMHQRHPLVLNEIHNAVRGEFPTWWIGNNYLNVETSRVFNLLDGSVSGLWTDYSGLNEKSKEQIEADKISEGRKKSGWDGLYFGAVAFKYQPGVNNLEHVSKIATKYMDVVTTSGDRTGSPPTWEKMARIKTAVQDHPVAIASGMSPENVHEYLDVADAFLVASSLLLPGQENFDPSRVRDFVQAVRR